MPQFRSGSPAVLTILVAAACRGMEGLCAPHAPISTASHPSANQVFDTASAAPASAPRPRSLAAGAIFEAWPSHRGARYLQVRPTRQCRPSCPHWPTAQFVPLLVCRC